MTENELAQTITKSIEDLGFARIKRDALIGVFNCGVENNLTPENQWGNYAQSNNLEYKNEEGDFVVFYIAGTEQPQIIS